MNILFASAELAPYVKTGGLGEIIATLPLSLQQRKHTVSVVVPLYRTLRRKMKSLRPTPLRLAVPAGPHIAHPVVWEGEADSGVRVWAIQQDEYFDREGLYGCGEEDYFDNAHRFAFFSRAVVELALHLDPVVEVIHGFDWQVSLIPVYMRERGLPFKSIVSIHNLAYQGSFPAADFAATNLPDEFFTPEGIEFYEQVNFLKGGILYADAVTTLSPTYAREVQFEHFGMGLNGVLEENNYKLLGILNGIDTREWNPSKDSSIVAKYDARRLGGKADCKADLLKALKLRTKGEKAAALEAVPVVAYLATLDPCKGADLVLEAADRLVTDKGVRLAILGEGDARYLAAFKDLARSHPRRVAFHEGFPRKLYHRAIAGADFLLMPSEYEPGGLNQLYAQAYGTIPIVRDTGGLSDSVSQWNGTSGTGFLFSDATPEALLSTVDAALAVRQNKSAWLRLRRNAMQADFSWEKSVASYEKLYKNLLLSPNDPNEP